MNLLIKELFSTNLNLFFLTNTDDPRYMILKNNHDPELYLFTGKLIGKALLENIPINCGLSKVIYKHILGVPLDSEDIQYVDKDLYESMKYMQNNSIEGVFYEVFAIPDENGRMRELVDNGKDLQVTDENKDFYINLRVYYELNDSIERSAKCLKEGIFTIFPQEMISRLSIDELDFLLCGTSTINLSEWQKFTVYKGRLSIDHHVVRWFWEILHDFSQKQLSDLLFFVTVNYIVPVEGFENLKTSRGDPARFTLEPMNYFKGVLPRAHICFNRMDLPLYQTRQQLEAGLSEVINNYKFGFGLE